MSLFKRSKKKTNRQFSANPRDDYKSKEYYLKELQTIDDFLSEIESGVKKIPKADIKQYYYVVNMHVYQRFCILYVLQADIKTLTDEALRYCRNWYAYTQLGGELYYSDLCSALSFYLLLSLDHTEIAFLEHHMIEEKCVDAVLDLLRNTAFHNQAVTDKSFYFKDKGYFSDDYTDSTGELMKAIRAEDKEIRTAEFVNYLETVKKPHYRRLLKYYEKIGEDHYTYIGSYDFRITAVAKILEIDKAAIADSKFIAADLL